MRRRVIKLATGLCLAAPVSWPASAHGGHDNRVLVQTGDRWLMVETTVSAPMLKAFDTNKDGVLTLAEVRAQGVAIRVWAQENIRLSDAAGTIFSAEFLDTPAAELAGNADDTPVEHVRLVERFLWQKGETPVALDLSLPWDSEKPVYVLKDRKIIYKTRISGPVRLALPLDPA